MVHMVDREAFYILSLPFRDNAGETLLSMTTHLLAKSSEQALEKARSWELQGDR